MGHTLNPSRVLEPFFYIVAPYYPLHTRCSLSLVLSCFLKRNAKKKKKKPPNKRQLYNFIVLLHFSAVDLAVKIACSNFIL